MKSLEEIRIKLKIILDKHDCHCMCSVFSSGCECCSSYSHYNKLRNALRDFINYETKGLEKPETDYSRYFIIKEEDLEE